MSGRKTTREMLLLVVLGAWCCFGLATEGANGAEAARRDGDEDGGDGSGGAGGGELTQSQPHIVFIVADDLGWNDVPWHNEEVYAPILESLASEGVILEESYVQPLCSPSRSALMSGRYPFTIGRQHLVIWPEEPTGLNLNLTLLPQALKAAGYETHAVGKWHLGFCSWAYTPTERGFDTFYGYYLGQEDYYQHTRTTVFEEKHTPCNDLDCDFPLDEENAEAYLDLRNNTDPDTNKNGVYSTYLFASQAENLLATRVSQVPMFLYLPFQSVHAPLEVPDQYMKPYEDIQDQNRRTYLGMVTALDEAVGRVVKALKDTGHYNNTVIVFTTDNGGPTSYGANNWPLRGNKSTLWEGGTRGAAFVHSPLLPNPGTSNPMLMHITDWLPTLLGLAGGEVPEGIDGVDQWSALTMLTASARENLVYNIDNTTEFSAGVRMDKYKLLVGNPGPGEWTPPPEYKDVPRDDAHDAEDADAVADDNDEQKDNELENEVAEEEETEEVIVRASDFVGEVGRLLQHMTGSKASEIRLYDLESDPSEEHNVAANNTQVVAIMTQMLNEQLARYTPADVPDRVPASNPSNFGGVWSPGWC